MSKPSYISNFFWRFFERIGAKGIEFLVTIILARILAPQIYGQVAMILVIINILQIFVDSGLGIAIIQKKDADTIDYSSVFFFNLFFCICIYILIYLIAPYIADFYNVPSLIPVIRFIGLAVIFSGVKNIQQAYVTKNMMFRKFFFATLTGTVCAGILGIIIAYSGGGVWALAIQHICNLLIDTIVLWLITDWRPTLVFSLGRIKSLYCYGWKILASQLLETIYQEARNMIIGKLYTSASLAFYTRGSQFPQFVTANINTSINSILLPALAKEQDDKLRVRNMTQQALKICTYVIAPMMVGLGVTSTPLVHLLLTEKWLPCVPFLQIFCISFLFLPLHTINLNAIKALGRSNLYLKLEIQKKLVEAIALFASMWHGPMAMAYSLLITNIICQFINSWPNNKLLNYGYREQLKDILPSIFLSLIMGICIFPIHLMNLPNICILSMQCILGILIYLGLSILFKREEYYYLLGICKSYIQTKKNTKGKNNT